MKIYVVTGQLGECEPDVWNVCAFSDKETAELYASLSTEESARLYNVVRELRKKAHELFPIPSTLRPGISKRDEEEYRKINKLQSDWVMENHPGSNKYDLDGYLNSVYDVEEIELDGNLP